MSLPQIAAIVTEYRHRAHADVIVGKFLRGFPCDDGLHPPRVRIASLYLDQVNPTDIGVATAVEFGVPLYPSIRSALTLGGEALAVDGVLLIGEHGDYPWDEADRHLYPRRHFLEQIAGVMVESKRAVPVFVDKHLSYNWPDAHWMVARARSLGIPLLAGSSLPTAWRRPWVEHPLGAPLEAAVVIGYGGLESYGFHALEALQCQVERRAGGETGVASVCCLEGADVWRWLAAHPAHAALAKAAGESIAETAAPWERVAEVAGNAAAFIVQYRDGLTGAVLMLNGYSTSFAYAGLSAGRAEACEIVLQGTEPHGHFSYLCRNIEELFLTGRPPYPVERTILTTGMLNGAMESRLAGCVWLPTPHLALAYAAAEGPFWRATGPAPAGATLDPWPPAR
jgi:hypothetical protein